MSALSGSASGGKKMAKIVLSSLILTLVLSTVLALPSVILAATADSALEGLGEFGGAATDLPQTDTDLRITIGKIVQIFLGFLGVLAVVLIIYAGFLWMTAGGDSAKVDKAKDYIKNAVIGIVIILAAYVITTFVLGQIQESLT